MLILKILYLGVGLIIFMIISPCILYIGCLYYGEIKSIRNQILSRRVNESNILESKDNNQSESEVNLLLHNDQVNAVHIPNRLRMFLDLENAMIVRYPREIINVSKLRRMTPDEKKNMVETTCSIGIDPLEQDPAKPLIFLPCNQRHIFHEDCIISWLDEEQNCPTCKQEITEEAVERYPRLA